MNKQNSSPNTYKLKQTEDIRMSDDEIDIEIENNN